MKKKKLLILILLIVPIFSTVFSPSIGQGDYDYVIKNGNIYNPSTDTELMGYNLGIVGDRVKRITKADISGREEINAEGLVVSPGFIDLISYDPNPYGIEFKVLDGVTSNLAMHGGTEDAEAWYDFWENQGVITNFGASTFVTRLRWPIVGGGVDAEVDNQEDINRLVASVRENIEKGSLGISFSFEYIPGVKNEVIPLLELAEEYKAPSFYHLRYSDAENELKGIEEVLKYGRKTKAPIHIMHINSTGGTFHMDQALELIEKAQAEGLDVTACIYPYDFWATYIDSARFREGWQDRFKIDYGDLQIGGSSERISKESFQGYRQKHILVAAHNSIPEESNLKALEKDYLMIGSDTIIEEGNNHPRGSGTYGRLFRKYVREDQVLSLMEAIKKASYLPSKRMEDIAPSMRSKGRIEYNSSADLTIFDPDNIRENSTIEYTDLASSGIEYVFVNGVLVKDKNGLIPDRFPGKPIKSYFMDPIEEDQAYELKLVSKYEEGKVSSLKLDGLDYLPLLDVLDFFKLRNTVNVSGKIDIKDFGSIYIGDVRTDGLASLRHEPLMYKEDFYIEKSDLVQILGTRLDLNLEDGIRIEELEFKKDSKDFQREEEEVKPSKKTFPKNKLAILVLSLIFVLLAIRVYNNRSY